MASLFGPSPQEVQQAQLQRQQAEAMQYAQMPQGRGMVAAAAGAGQALGRVAGALGGFKDPQMQKAMLMEEAKQEVDASGVDLMNDSQGYYQATAKALAKRGLTDEAMQVRAIAIQEQTSMAEAGYKQAQAAAETTNAGKGVFAQSRNGQVIDTRTGKVVAQGTGPQYAPTETEKLTQALENPELDPNTRQVLEARLAKLTHITPPATTTISIDKGQNKYSEKVGTMVAERDMGIIAAANAAAEIADEVDRTMELLNDSSAITGAGGELELGLAKVFNIMGADNGDTIAATQALMGTLAGATLKAIPGSNLGGGQGFTERDKQFLISSSSGEFTWDKESLQYLARNRAQQAYNDVKAYNDWVSKIDPSRKRELESLNGYALNIKPLPKVPPRPKWNDKWSKIPTKTSPSKINIPQGWEGNPEEWDALSPRGKELWQKVHQPN